MEFLQVAFSNWLRESVTTPSMFCCDDLVFQCLARFICSSRAAARVWPLWVLCAENFALQRPVSIGRAPRPASAGSSLFRCLSEWVGRSFLPLASLAWNERWRFRWTIGEPEHLRGLGGTRRWASFVRRSGWSVDSCEFFPRSQPHPLWKVPERHSVREIRPVRIKKARAVNFSTRRCSTQIVSS